MIQTHKDIVTYDGCVSKCIAVIQTHKDIVTYDGSVSKCIAVIQTHKDILTYDGSLRILAVQQIYKYFVLLYSLYIRKTT